MTGGTLLASDVTKYKPTAAVSDTFYIEARSNDVTCTKPSGRTMVILIVQDCIKEVDLALKKSIDKKIVQVGDVVI